MTDTHPNAEAGLTGKDAKRLPQRTASVPSAAKKRRSLSMHEGIAVWCDCCSCEAEPYWVEAAEAMGIKPGSDYEDADR
jgi:hypothetical protein